MAKKRKKKIVKKRKQVKKAVKRTRRPRKVRVECTVVQPETKIQIDENQTLGNKARFQAEIQKLRETGLTALEAIQEYCEMHSIEPETIPKLLTPSLMQDLHSEAQEFNLIKKVNTVPI